MLNKKEKKEMISYCPQVVFILAIYDQIRICELCTLAFTYLIHNLFVSLLPSFAACRLSLVNVPISSGLRMQDVPVFSQKRARCQERNKERYIHSRSIQTRASIMDRFQNKLHLCDNTYDMILNAIPLQYIQINRMKKE